MELFDITTNDDLRRVGQKCNSNFKSMGATINNMMKKQGNLSKDGTTAEIDAAISTLTNVTLPEEVATQIDSANIPLQVSNAIADADIPTMVQQEVTSHIPDAYPPVGSYILTEFDPSGTYPGTIWQQVDSITTDGASIIPLWQRVVQ